MKIKPSKPTLFPDGRASIYLKKSEVDISDVVTFAREHDFVEQTSRHITVIGGRTEDSIGVMLNESESLGGREVLINKIKKLLNLFDWEYTSKEGVYHLKKTGTFGQDGIIIEDRETLVRPIDMPDMERFYSELNRLLNTDFLPQFPHITLFTKGDRPNAPFRGIGISSRKVFDQLKPQRVL